MKLLHESPNLLIAGHDDLVYYKMKRDYVDEKTAFDCIDIKTRVVTAPHYAFMDYRMVTKADLGGMKVFTEDIAYKQIKASALLLSGGLGAMLGEIYLNIRKPPYAFDLFTEPRLAIEWMKAFNPGFSPHLETIVV